MVKSFTNVSGSLIVPTGPPISPNPNLVKNATHVSLLWSPPFLWPGHRIKYYNVSLTYNSDERETSYFVNETYSTKVATLTWEIRSLTCTSTQVIFSITAINLNLSLQEFNITEQLSPLGKVLVDMYTVITIMKGLAHWFRISFPLLLYYVAPEFASSAINVSILFEANGTPRWLQAVVQVATYYFIIIMVF